MCACRVIRHDLDAKTRIKTQRKLFERIQMRGSVVEKRYDGRSDPKRDTVFVHKRHIPKNPFGQNTRIDKMLFFVRFFDVEQDEITMAMAERNVSSLAKPEVSIAVWMHIFRRQYSEIGQKSVLSRNGDNCFHKPRRIFCNEYIFPDPKGFRSSDSVIRDYDTTRTARGSPSEKRSCGCRDRHRYNSAEY